MMKRLMLISLTLHHTISTFNSAEEEGFSKTAWEKDEMLVTSILSISHTVSYPIKEKFHHFSYL